VGGGGGIRPGGGMYQAGPWYVSNGAAYVSGEVAVMLCVDVRVQGE
jgi:hypothetical protein